MIKAIAIDDEPLALEIIQEFCKAISALDLTKTFSNPKEALKYLQKFPVDLIFLDIKMPLISGIELSKYISQETMIIFTTAYSEYAVESYNLSAVDYLLKPFEESRFVTAVNKARELFFLKKNTTTKSDYILIRADYKLIKVLLDHILYIESFGDYLKIMVSDQKQIVARMTMKNILDLLPNEKFVRVHRSFIVPTNKLKEIRNKKIVIENKKIPIGNSYENDFLKQFFS